MLRVATAGHCGSWWLAVIDCALGLFPGKEEEEW